MDKIKTKIKLVFVPYLIISLSTLIGWTFLHWLFFVDFNIYQGIIMIIVPSVLSLTLILIWLYKRIKLLSIKSERIVWYLLVPCLTMGGLSLFGQQYFDLTNSKLTHISSISQIDKEEPTKFYTLKNFYLDKKHFSIKKQFKASGKHMQNLVMHVYITVPILNSVKDTLGTNCIAWYGIKYTGTVYDFGYNHDINGIRDEIDINKNLYAYYYSSINQIENSDEVNRFIKENMTNFDYLNINHFLYLNRISKTESDYDNYVLAIKNNAKYDTKSDVVLLPVNESLTERANDNLMAALAIFGVGSLLFLIMVISPKLKSEDEILK
ncbi:MAG: hypothetical protein ACI7YS_01735 [Flavobacterium sp.]